jgi:hypothetical protein
MSGNLAVLYDVEWQKLRVSLLAKNDSRGGFTTFKGVANNMRRLNDYVFGVGEFRMGGDESITDEEMALRLWRAINLLNATRMGYSGQGKKGDVEDVLIESFRNSYRDAYTDRMKTYVKKADRNWRWLKVFDDLKHLYAADKSAFDQIREDLLSRERKARERHNHVDDTRHDLVLFLAFMADAETWHREGRERELQGAALQEDVNTRPEGANQ